MTPETTAPRRGLYLYAVVPGDARIGALAGVQDRPVDVRYASGLGAVISEVDTWALAAVTDESADTELLEGLARQHDSVVRAVAAETGAALPFRLGTVLTGPAAVAELLATREGELRHALDRVRGCDEWGVRVRAGTTGVADQSSATDHAGATDQAATGGSGDATGGPGDAIGGPGDATGAGSAGQAGAGIAYLRRCREQLDRAQRREQESATLAAEVDRRLGGIAVDALPGRGGAGLLLDRSYLVRRDDLDAFIAAVDECGDRLAAAGHELRLNGPWPTYSFAGTGTGAGGDG